MAAGTTKKKEYNSQDANDHENGVDAAVQRGSVGVGFWGHGVESVLGSWGKF